MASADSVVKTRPTIPSTYDAERGAMKTRSLMEIGVSARTGSTLSMEGVDCVSSVNSTLQVDARTGVESIHSMTENSAFVKRGST